MKGLGQQGRSRLRACARGRGAGTCFLKRANGDLVGNIQCWDVTFEVFGQGGADGGDVAAAALAQLGTALQVCHVCGVVGVILCVGGGGRIAVGPGQLKGFFVCLGRVL